jgi:hypothetical protein
MEEMMSNTTAVRLAILVLLVAVLPLPKSCAQATELAVPDLRKPHICGVAGGSCRELRMQMSQAEYERFRHQQYMRQKQREFHGHWGRYQQWLQRYKQLEANPALATRRRCPAGYIC